MPPSPSPRTPGMVLAGVITLGIASVLALPSPLFAGLLLAPAFVVSAIIGYLSFRWGPILGAVTSSATAVVAAVTVLLIIVLPAAEMTFTSALGVLLAMFCAFCGFAGTAMLWLGSRRARTAPQQASHSSPPYRQELPADAMHAFRGGADSWTPEPTPETAGPMNTGRSLWEDASRVRAAAAIGVGHAASAWRTGKTQTAPWRRRMAHKRAVRDERREREHVERARLRRVGEEQEIHKAQLRQAKDYNSSRLWW